MKNISMGTRWPSPAAFLLTSLLLAFVGFGYLVHGTYGQLTQAGDYRMHWIEERYVFRGKNPADIFARIQAESQHKPVPHNGRDNSVDADLGPADGAYPLWSYFTAALLTWPPTFDSGRFYNCVVNLALFAALLFWAYGLARKEEQWMGWFLAASFFAVNSICTTFIVGQYGVVVVAALVAAYLLDQKNHWLAGGVCLGIAMIKLSIAAPFVLPFLVRGRWKLLFVAGGYLVVGSLLIWPLIKTNPFEIMGQMTVAAEHFENKGYSLNNLLELFGMGAQSAMRVAAVVSLGLALSLLYLWRASSDLVLYAIAAVASRAWCYHRLYDNLILVFLLLALGVTAFRTRSPLALIAYFLVGITLWVPGRLTNDDWWIILQWAGWVIGLVILLQLEPKSSALGREEKRQG
jgi:hypothetical protein